MINKHLIERIFKVSPEIKQPKYRQLVDRVIDAINAGELHKGDSLPSINVLCTACGVSRDTVVKAYNQLKQIGALIPVHGKGYYINCHQFQNLKRVFVLFDELANPYKTALSNSMRDEICTSAELDFYFHHYSPKDFAHLLLEAKGQYEYYVIMTFDNDLVKMTLSELDQSRLLILDQFNDFPNRSCAFIRQDYQGQLARALAELNDRIGNYSQLNMVFPEAKPHSRSIKQGFEDYCQANGVKGQIIDRLADQPIEKGQAYFVIEDDDLVQLIKHCRMHALQPGRDIGILSYNDTPFKEIIDQGITVVSVDFADMGRRAAQQILNPSAIETVCPTRAIKRKSL